MKMRYISYFLILLTTISYSQTETELIKDSCTCIETIPEDLSQDETKRLVMDCTLNAFKENRSYTEKVVKEFTGKRMIDGKDVFQYHQEIFHNVLFDKCFRYKKIIAEVQGTTVRNGVVGKVGKEICDQLPDDLTETAIKTTVDRISVENQKEVSEKYRQNGNEYITDLKKYLISNCGKYRQYILDKGI